MIYLIFSLTQALSCLNICEPCSAGGILVIRNPCTSAINTTYHQDNLSCRSCRLSNGQERPCKEIIMTSQPCSQSQKCEKSSYKLSDSKLKVPILSKSEICVSNIDLRKTKQSTQKISLDFSGGKISKLIIFTYFLPYNYVVDPYWKTGMIEIDGSNYTRFKDFTLYDTNYLVVVYYTYNENIDYAGFKLSWNGSDSNGSQLSTILTIVALCLSIVFCIGCCGILCRRLYKSTRSSARVYHRNGVNGMRNLRNYQQVPESTIISESDVDRLFPKELFKEEMLEVGEKICCVCFEDFSEQNLVRKLICKHIFHSKCIEDWFIGKNTQTKCPLCKCNPFELEIQELAEPQPAPEPNYIEINQVNEEYQPNEDNAAPSGAVHPDEFQILNGARIERVEIIENDNQAFLK